MRFGSSNISIYNIHTLRYSFKICHFVRNLDYKERNIFFLPYNRLCKNQFFFFLQSVFQCSTLCLNHFLHVFIAISLNFNNINITSSWYISKIVFTLMPSVDTNNHKYQCIALITPVYIFYFYVPFYLSCCSWLCGIYKNTEWVWGKSKVVILAMSNVEAVSNAGATKGAPINVW